MQSYLAYEFASVTEAAALAAFEWLARGDKNTADAAAVEAMRARLQTIEIQGEIVIGEGEIDEAPMLYIGEQLGCGGAGIDIAVDPIDGTRMTAMGQAGAVVVLAAAPKGGLLAAPDMYMEKLVCGPKGRGLIDLSKTVLENILIVAEASGKALNEMAIVTLAKPRHDALIAQLHSLGVRVYAQPDGDVAASVLTCFPETGIDLMYCMGGAPEGVISAAAVRALGGDMQARLVPRTEAKGVSVQTQVQEKLERERCQQMGVKIDRVLVLDQLASCDELIFCMSGITQGELVDGVKIKNGQAHTDTLVVNGVDKRVQKISSTHLK